VSGCHLIATERGWQKWLGDRTVQAVDCVLRCACGEADSSEGFTVRRGGGSGLDKSRRDGHGELHWSGTGWEQASGT
jgi:hypothetical protein